MKTELNAALRLSMMTCEATRHRSYAIHAQANLHRSAVLCSLENVLAKIAGDFVQVDHFNSRPLQSRAMRLQLVDS